VSQGFEVDPAQIRTHAGNVDDIAARFGAVKAASAHIAGDEAAYGMLCGWIAGVLESRHVRQDELFAYAEENLTLAAESLRAAASNYDDVDLRSADAFDKIRGRMP
jgi:hypothetical protein